MAVLSRSPLCPHVEQGNAGATNPDGWLRQQPALPQGIKFLNLDACREAKGLDARIFTVYRRYVADQMTYISRGAEGGRAWVRDWRHVEGVDCGESPNEAIGFDDAAGWRLYNTFLLGFIEECVRRGVTPVIANIAVGNPREDLVALTRDAVQACGEVGGYVGYHGYGPAIIRDIEGEVNNTEQYHGYSRDQVNAADIHLVSRGPLLLTPLWRQAGVTAAIRYLYTESIHDGCNTPIENGGMGALIGRRLPDGHVIDWPHIIRNHELYARRMREIGVERAFMFTFWGTAEWVQHEYTTRPQLMEWYTRHLVEFEPVPEPPPPPPPPPPPDPEPLPSKVIVTATPYANIRSEPRVAAETDLGDAYPDAEGDVLGKQVVGAYTWWRVRLRSAGGPLLVLNGVWLRGDTVRTLWPTPLIWPVLDVPRVYTQAFGVNAEYYQQFGLPGHEGVDIRAPLNAQLVAAGPGRITRIDRIGDPTRGNYGYSIRQTWSYRGRSFIIVYAHGVENSAQVTVGQEVRQGQPLMKSNATGNVIQGRSHLHVTMLEPGVTFTDALGRRWPRSITDPTPFLPVP